MKHIIIDQEDAQLNASLLASMSLADIATHCNVHNASGYSAALSKARTIFSKSPDSEVVLLLNSHFTPPHSKFIEERKDFVQKFVDHQDKTEVLFYTNPNLP